VSPGFAGFNGADRSPGGRLRLVYGTARRPKVEQFYIDFDILLQNRLVSREVANDPAGLIDGVGRLIGQEPDAIQSGCGAQEDGNGVTAINFLDEAGNVWESDGHG